MYYFVFVYSAKMGKFHFLVELQAPLLLFTGPNMRGSRRQRALSTFHTGFSANPTGFPGGSLVGRRVVREMFYILKALCSLAGAT